MESEIIEQIALSLQQLVQEQGRALEAAEIIRALESDAVWLDQLEQQAETRLRAVTERMLQHWQQELTAQLGRIAGENDTPGLVADPSASTASPLGSLASRPLRRSLEGLAQRLFSRESRRSEESSRSQQQEQRYRASRGQLQAELAGQLERGQRYR